jgi:Na+/proline symporter
MVSSEHRTGLYVAIPITFWAYRRMEKMKHEGVTDQLQAHYLGGREFGSILTAGTIFASFFSGYTVVGVPDEAYEKGWIALRWLPSSAGIIAGFIGTSLR